MPMFTSKYFLKQASIQSKWWIVSIYKEELVRVAGHGKIETGSQTRPCLCQESLYKIPYQAKLKMKWTIWLMWECWGEIFWRRLIPRILSSILVWEPRAEGAFGNPAACRRYSMSTACVRGLCWDAAAAYFLFFYNVLGQRLTIQHQNMQVL